MLEKVAEIFGASAVQYKHLLEVERKVERRASQAQPGFSNMSLWVTCGLGVIMSALVAMMPFLISTEVSPFTFSLLSLTMSMVMVGIWTLPYFDIFLSPMNYPVVAHTPVASRTYFLVKLTQLLTYTVLLLGCLNLLPAICGIWVRSREATQPRFLFPFVYLPVAFVSGFFVVGVLITLSGYLTKLYSRRGFRNIAQYAQFALPAMFPAFIYLLPVTPAAYESVLKWVYVFPSGWFAGIISLTVGGPEHPDMMRDLILTGLAVVSVVLLIVIPLRSIAKGYSKYLVALLESGNRQKVKLRVKPSLLARLCRSRTTYAGFCLAAVYMRRDKHILHGLFSAMGGVVMLLVLCAQGRFSVEWLEYAAVTGMSPLFTACFSTLGVSFICTFLVRVRYSEHWKAAWILSLGPLKAPGQLWRGVLLTAFLYIVVPYTLLLICAAAVFWGAMALFYILPGLIFLLYFTVLFPRPYAGIPLSLEIVQASRTYDLLSFIYGLLGAGVLIGLQVLALSVHIGVYIAVYCVIVVGGFIGFVYFFKRR